MNSQNSGTSPAAGWRLEHSYAGLPGLFHSAIAPTPVRAPRLVIFNRSLAESLGLRVQHLQGDAGALCFSGNQLPAGAAPLAQAYAGHQYGHFTALGDGRAILLGEQITPRGERFDVQFKGSGPTPYSRRGDGRAALGPMLREYIISEAMAGLGIPTTRSLAVTATGEDVFRPEPLPGAVLTRVAASHIRVGTFEWAAAAGDASATSTLVDYTLSRHYPELAGAENRSLALLEAVIERQAVLLAQWMTVGFVHGVMNTDNMALSGETIDYGPCAFVDTFHPATVFSSIDRHGRYSYGNQPGIAQWNLTRLAEALLKTLHPEQTKAIDLAEGALDHFEDRYQFHWLAGMRRKLGLFQGEPEDAALAKDLLDWMQNAKADFTNTFLALDPAAPTAGEGAAGERFAEWHLRWVERLGRQEQCAAESGELRRACNPLVIPRNHRVEAALFAAQQGDTRPMERLLEAVATPFDRTRNVAEFCSPAPAGEAPYRTFCGT